MTATMHCSSKIQVLVYLQVSAVFSVILPWSSLVDEGPVDLGQVIQQPLDMRRRGWGGRHVGPGGVISLTKNKHQNINI